MTAQFKIESFNIEITTCCPLKCPQCYCSLTGGKHIPLARAKEILRQAANAGARHVELSGGETLLYPHLYELIQAASEYGLETNIAISGWGFTFDVLQKLKAAKLTNIFVSLNGPTEETNALTRDGFHLAINALKILQEANFQNVLINWVMHRQTADLLPEMISLAEKYSVKAIVVMQPKPTARHELESIPTREQMEAVVKTIRNNKSKVKIYVETCFSPLLALYGKNWLTGNLNIGENKGCSAGRSSFSVNVDGAFSPCRHLEYFENNNSLTDYWKNSEILSIIRNLENHQHAPCDTCEFCKYCRHCLSINAKLNNSLYIGNELCPLANTKKQ